jgi:DNA-binding IclR family transcriptional regulator
MELEDHKGRYTNQSLVRGLMILEQFYISQSSLGISELSKLTGLHKSTVHRLVATLEEIQWLHRTEGDKFQIAIKPIVLGRKAAQQVASLTITHDFLRELRDRLQETVVLTMIVENEIICVDKANSHQSLNCSSEIGKVYPCHAGATGFGVLLGMDEFEARSFLEKKPLERYTDHTITDIDALMLRYRKERSQGYTIASGQKDSGITGIAMPLWFPAEKTYGSLGVLTPDYRITEETKENIIAELKKCVDKIRMYLTPALSSLD